MLQIYLINKTFFQSLYFQIKLKTKDKVLEIDKALDGLRSKFITTSTEVKQTNNTTPSATAKVDENVENCKIEATEKLETMQL